MFGKWSIQVYFYHILVCKYICNILVKIIIKYFQIMDQIYKSNSQHNFKILWKSLTSIDKSFSVDRNLRFKYFKLTVCEIYSYLNYLYYKKYIYYQTVFKWISFQCSRQYELSNIKIVILNVQRIIIASEFVLHNFKRQTKVSFLLKQIKTNRMQQLGLWFLPKFRRK